MTKQIISKAIIKLGYVGKFSIDNDNVIDWYDNEPLKQSKIDAKVIEIQEEYNVQEYARLRKAEYARLNQLEMMFDDKQNGTNTWIDSINDIKNKYPKMIRR